MHARLSETAVHVYASPVWIHMLRTDSLTAALAEAAALPYDRLEHFHDPRHRVGKAIAGALGAGLAVVWDAYLILARDAQWIDEPTRPIDWANQLRAGWADPAHFRWKDDLDAWLRIVFSDIQNGGMG